MDTQTRTSAATESSARRRDRRALLGAALGAVATVTIAPIATSARTVHVDRTTGPRGATGPTGVMGPTGGAVPELAVARSEFFVEDGKGYYMPMYCPEPDMIAFSFGWKNLPQDWVAWRRFNTVEDKSRIAVGFLDIRTGGPPNEGAVEMQVFCIRGTVVQDPG